MVYKVYTLIKESMGKMAARESKVEILYNDLLKRFNIARKLNMKLLEEKRELLLRIQCGSCFDNTRPCFESLDEKNVDGTERGKGAGSTNHSLESLTERNDQLELQYKSLMDDYKELESDFLKLKEESKRDREENDHLRELIDKLSSDLENIKKPRKRNLNGVLYDNEDVEALKQQLAVYREDFEQERKDKEKSRIDNETLEERLKKANRQLEKLSLENVQYKNDFNQVKQQKELLLSEMRKLSTSSLPLSPVFECYMPVDERFSCTNCQDVIPRSRNIKTEKAFSRPACQDLACS